jgi:hypothetical protein
VTTDGATTDLVATVRSPSPLFPRSSAASKTNKSSIKKCRRGKSPVVDGKLFDAFAEASQIARTKMKELKRHNGFMEALEERKLAMEERKDTFARKMELLQGYEQIKNENG